MTLLFVLLFGCIGRSAPLPAHPDGSLRTPVARLGLDSGDSTPDSVPESPDSAPDSTDTGDTGTVTLIYDTPDQTVSGIYGFGCDVASGGDIDGDGYDDLVASDDWTGTDDDRFWLSSGSPAGLTAPQEFRLANHPAARWMAGPVSIVGDTNGDGFDDVIASGYWCPGSAAFDASACVGLAGGISNADAGDLNGDGYGDVVFGYTDPDSANDVGSIYVFDGGPDGMTEDAEYRGSSQGDHFGWAVAGGMDINGDGYSDVLGIGDSEVAVFYGAATGFAGGTASDGQNIGYCSRCDANNAGDIDGDGYDEVAVGSVDLFYGSAEGVDLGAIDHRDDAFHAASAGDVDHDGHADLLYLTSSGIGLFPGGPGGAAGTAALDLRSNNVVWTVTAGDLDGDGIPDVIGGAPFDGPDPSCDACVYVWLGSTITDPSRASTDTGGDSGRDTHTGGDTHTGEDSDSGTRPDSDSPADSDHADSGTADTSAARKSGCGSGGGCDAAGGAFDPGGLLVLLVALTRRRPPRS